MRTTLADCTGARRFQCSAAQSGLVLAWLLAVPAIVLAQVGGGSLVGLVTNPSGEGAGDAKATAIKVGTNERHQVYTTGDGHFESPLLPSGVDIPAPQPGLVDMDYRGDISQHDLVYLSPPIHGRDGLPVGDGEAGAILWNPPDGLMFQINHTAIWDQPPVRRQGKDPLTEAEKEGVRSTNRYAAHLSIDTGVPMFDWKYLSDYEARLDLYDAETQLRAEGALGSASLKALYSHPHHTLLIEYHDETPMPSRRRIALSRLGSRTIAGWAARIVQDPEIGLPGTTSGSSGNEFWIEQKLGSMRFAVAVLLQAPAGSFAIQTLNTHEAVAESAPLREAHFTLYLAVAHSDETGRPLQLARERVRKAARDGAEKVRAMHRADWVRQWQRSFVDLPQDRYWENLWRLIDYMNVSSRRGQNPPFFINSIWSWTSDVEAWAGSYFHWNMWSPNFPLFDEGRVDLLRPYFAWKKRQLPHAIEFARKEFGVDGAAFTDYASPRGEQTMTGGNMRYNITPGAEIAQEFYKYWEYTQDDGFLKREALPFLRETARFYLNYMEEGHDGKLHIRKTAPYEFHGPYQFRDCITDEAMVRWLFPALIHAEQVTHSVTELSARAREALARLAPIQTGPIHPDWLIEQGGRKVYANPFFRGETYAARDRVFSTGYSTKAQRYVTHMEVAEDPSSVYGVMCGAEVCPIWPAGLVGPDESPERRDATGKNSTSDIAMWEEGRNGLRTMRKFPSATLKATPRTHSDRYLSWTGHNEDLPAFARLGLVKELRTAMETYVQKYQILPQGFWNYWDWGRWQGGVSYPKGSNSGKRIPFPEDPRILHSSLEPTGIFAVTVNEMLMTSYDGVIRLFPAYDRDAGFRLAAVGGFWVTSRRENGDVQFVQIESYAGRPCVVSNPWPGRKVELKNLKTGARVAYTQQLDRIRFGTEKGDLYVLVPEGLTPQRWRVSGVRRSEPRLYQVKLHTIPLYHIETDHGMVTKILGKQRDF